MKKYDIIILSGGFNPIHKGHIRLFKAAKNLAHKVIVGLNSDSWMVSKYGKTFMNYAERAEIISAIKYVDEVMPFSDEDGTAIDILTRVQRLYPSCSIAFGNGGDRTEKNTPEKGFCNAYRIDMLFGLGGDKIQSSSKLLDSSIS